MSFKQNNAKANLLIKGSIFFLIALFIDRVVIGHFNPAMEPLQIKHIALATVSGMLIAWLRNRYKVRVKE